MSKMAEYTTNDYKNNKRRESRSKIRQALFVNEYVEIKYFQIYEEAALLYNSINKKHPCKPDLRRTNEFRSWKNALALKQDMPITPIPRQKRRPYVHKPHTDILLPVNIDHTARLIVLPDESNQNSTPTTEDQSPSTEINSSKIMQLKIPLLASSKKKPRQTPVETPDKVSFQGLQGIVFDEVIQESADIPQPSLPNETEIVFDETIQESTDIPQPSLLDEIAPEVIEKIIAELRQEPELMDIVADVEQRIELEEVGLEIDIPELADPLQDELENILW